VPQTTLGYEKLVNWAFQLDDETRFVEAVLQGQPDPPLYFATMKRMNRDGPSPRPDLPLPRRNGMDLLRVIFDGHLVLDVRPAAVFTKGFIRGALNIPLTRSFLSYAGWLVPYDRDIYILTDADNDNATQRAAAELSMIGLDRIAGWFGLDAFAGWNAAGRSLETIDNLTPDDVAAARRDDDVTIVDVRNESEWEGGRIPGSRLAPLGRLAEQVQDLPRDARIVLVCQSGNRSVIGASVLAAHGYHDVAHLAGGVTEWRRVGLPLERESGALTPT
jgi:hydroxyacylglutathione hydrolase